ncbi:MAG: helix-turn-helix domain-containing protein [Candidatus Falkowbacteria bacterium]|nr:helix-turn-helix domain-containing protein [Candidatus Falkowbacteria bacterium]
MTKVEKIEPLIINPLWVSVSEAAKIGGIKTKTIRRGIQNGSLRYKIIHNRYLIDFSSVIHFLLNKTKLKNKLNQNGIGQCVEKWKE